MTNKDKQIVVIEDAKGIADGYKAILEKAGYNVSILGRLTLREIQTFVDEGRKFDLAILDIVLPVEDEEQLELVHCQETGLRLIERLVESGICCRFYVITVRSTLRSQVERLCEEKKAALNFVYKLDYEPEKLLESVEELLDRNYP